MTFVLAIQVYLFTDHNPLEALGEERMLSLLLEGGYNLRVVAILLMTMFWTVVDYHPVLARTIRGSIVVNRASGEVPSMSDRLLRSVVKAVTFSVAPVLIFFAVFSEENYFLHDYVAKTRRVKVE